jgi:hypothetical protein
MKPYQPSEECLEKIEQIRKEAIRYVRLHRKMPPCVNITRSELKLVKEARKAGIVPRIQFKGKSEPVNISYGGYRHG